MGKAAAIYASTTLLFSSLVRGVDLYQNDERGSLCLEKPRRDLRKRVALKEGSRSRWTETPPAVLPPILSYVCTYPRVEHVTHPRSIAFPTGQKFLVTKKKFPRLNVTIRTRFPIVEKIKSKARHDLFFLFTEKLNDKIYFDAINDRFWNFVSNFLYTKLLYESN